MANWVTCQQRVIACHRDLDGPPHIMPAFDLGEIQVVRFPPVEYRGGVFTHRDWFALLRQKLERLAQAGHAVNFDAVRTEKREGLYGECVEIC